MKRDLNLKCIKNFYGTKDITFTKGNNYKGMIRFMIDKENGTIKNAIRVKDDSNKRILLYQIEDADIIKEYFIIE